MKEEMCCLSNVLGKGLHSIDQHLLIYLFSWNGDVLFRNFKPNTVHGNLESSARGAFENDLSKILKEEMIPRNQLYMKFWFELHLLLY